MPNLEHLWDELNHRPVHRFADWPNKEVPKGKPGVYLIYQEGRWIYMGMSFKNLQSRLSQHASGRRSGDQFCVYAGDGFDFAFEGGVDVVAVDYSGKGWVGENEIEGVGGEAAVVVEKF